MAPEQICGSIACPSPLSDQFSLGLVLYEMLSGKSAFFRPGEPIYATLRNVVEREPAPLDNRRLNQAVMRALKKNPAERYPNLSEFVAEILRCSTEPISLAQLPDQTARQRIVSWQELASFELPSEATTCSMNAAPAMALVSEEIPFEETATIRRKKVDLPPMSTRQLPIPATRALRRLRPWRQIVTRLVRRVALVLGVALVLLGAIGPGLLGDKTLAFSPSPVDLRLPSDLSVPVLKPLDLRAPPPDLVRSLPQAVPYAPDLAPPGLDGRSCPSAMPPLRLAQPAGTEGLTHSTVAETKPQTAPPRQRSQPTKRSRASKRHKSARQPSFQKRSTVPRREDDEGLRE